MNSINWNIKNLKSFGLLFAFCMAFISGIDAQPITTTSLKKMVEKAEMSLENNDYYSALEWYELSYDEDRNFDVAVKIAELHYKLRDYVKAGRAYKRIVNKRMKKGRPNPYMPDARLMYAKMLKYQGMYQEARAEFQLYISEAEDFEKIKDAKLEITGIALALEMDDQLGISVSNLGKKVNSKYSEYSPVLVNDRELYFTGFQRNEVLVLDGKEKDRFSKVFVSSKEEDGYTKAKELPSDNIHRDGYHIGNVSLSADQKTMYFTRAILNGNDLKESKVFISNMGDEGWGPAVELKGINGDYIVKQPTVGQLFNNEVIIFASDMDGGYGGFDLYYSTRTGDGYTPPINLGEIINTKQDEESPFYLDGTLYFSSMGHPGIGGFDIFNSLWNGSSWSIPNNLGKPYNSSVDDLYFSIDEEGYNGFMVSNRTGTRSVKSKTCCNDIYIVNKEKIVLELVASMFSLAVPLDSVSVSFADYTNAELGEVQSRMKRDTNVYSFALSPDKSYRIVARREGFYPDSLEFNTVGITASQLFEKKLDLKPIPKAPKEPEEEYEEFTINEAIRLNNIYYDYDDDKILKDAEQDLIVVLELMNQYSDMVIELGSHTDSRGPGQYNQALSQRRAESAKKWLVKKGISKERIQAVGYGEKNILNHCVNGTKCEDEEHRFNRRTEIKITAGPKTIQVKKTRLRKR